MSNTKELPILYTDRSRVEDAQRCDRWNYFGYNYPANWQAQLASNDGKISPFQSFGLSPIKPGLDMEIGSAVHKGVETLLSAFLRRPVEYLSTVPTEGMAALIDVAVRYARESFQLAFYPWIRDYNFGEITYDLIEAEALVEGMVRCFALAPMGLSKLLEEYEIIEVEKEISWPLFESDLFNIQFNSRPDGILLHRATGQYFAFSLKTAKEMNDWQSTGGKYDNQGLSELISAQKMYPNEQLVANQMLYLLKGRKTEDDVRGSWIYNSPLIHPYAPQLIDYDEESYRPEFYYTKPGNSSKSRLSNDYKRTDIWKDGHIGIAAWVSYLAETSPEILDKQIYTPIPFYRDQSAMDSWVRQTRGRELSIAASRQAMLDAFRTGNKEEIIETLDYSFPQSRTSCISPFKCQFIKLCHEGGLEGILEDNNAIEELGYRQREPNHPEYPLQEASNALASR